MKRRGQLDEGAQRDGPGRRPTRKPEDNDVDGPAGPDERLLLGLQEAIGNEAVHSVLSDEGSEIPEQVRHEMERSFGRPFAQVRIHEGGAVDRAADEIDAVAFTAGDDVYLRSDAPPLDTAAGRAVLAEELAHVAQGVGMDGAERILSPEDPAEVEAHRAAAAVTAGEPARVHAAPSAADAGGRILDVLALGGYGIYKYLTEEEVEAKKAEPHEEPAAEKDATSPTPEQVAVIKSGVVPQIDAALAKLAKPDVAPLEVIGDLQPVGQFLEGQQHPSLEGVVVSARQGVVSAIATLSGSFDAEKSIASTVGQLRSDAAVLEGVAAAAKEPPSSPAEGSPAPDALTPAQAAMLRSGPIAWLNEAAGELEGDSPDVDGAIGKIRGAGGALGGMSVPDALSATFNQHRLYCETYVSRLEATKLSINDGVTQATSQLQASRMIIEAMGELPPSGGA